MHTLYTPRTRTPERQTHGSWRYTHTTRSMQIHTAQDIYMSSDTSIHLYGYLCIYLYACHRHLHT